jgi:transcription-repair coupling factor (superfamily II helicase)
MRRFVSGEFDVLLCTTIIESGVDIPSANTILIDRADRFGISDLYQLRGRVGRSSHKAYAYLLLPTTGGVESDARQRINAVMKYSSLSAGFSLALRDLEIRGAGNILGREQSGHITAVGFGLYCQLLKQSVAKLKGEPVPQLIDVELRLDIVELAPEAEESRCAAIPFSYIGDEPLRIGMYRKIAQASTQDEVESIGVELRDRFGPVPRPVSRLLTIAAVRLAAAARGIRLVETRGAKVRLFRGEDYLMRAGRFPRLSAGSVDAQLEELLHWVRAADEWGG